MYVLHYLQRMNITSESQEMFSRDILTALPGCFSEVWLILPGSFTVFHQILPGRFTAVQSQQLHLSADCYRVVCLLKKFSSVEPAKSCRTGLEQDCVAFCPG